MAISLSNSMAVSFSLMVDHLLWQILRGEEVAPLSLQTAWVNLFSPYFKSKPRASYVTLSLVLFTMCYICQFLCIFYILLASIFSQAKSDSCKGASPYPGYVMSPECSFAQSDSTTIN